MGRNLAEYFDGPYPGEPAECIGDFDRARLDTMSPSRGRKPPAGADRRRRAPRQVPLYLGRCRPLAMTSIATP